MTRKFALSQLIDVQEILQEVIDYCPKDLGVAGKCEVAKIAALLDELRGKL